MLKDGFFAGNITVFIKSGPLYIPIRISSWNSIWSLILNYLWTQMKIFFMILFTCEALTKKGVEPFLSSSLFSTSPFVSLSEKSYPIKNPQINLFETLIESLVFCWPDLKPDPRNPKFPTISDLNPAIPKTNKNLSFASNQSPLEFLKSQSNRSKILGLVGAASHSKLNMVWLLMANIKYVNPQDLLVEKKKKG